MNRWGSRNQLPLKALTPSCSPFRNPCPCLPGRHPPGGCGRKGTGRYKSPYKEIVADLGGLVPLSLGLLRFFLELDIKGPLLLKLFLGARALDEVRLARTDPGGRQSTEDRSPVESRLVPGLDPGQKNTAGRWTSDSQNVRPVSPRAAPQSQSQGRSET